MSKQPVYSSQLDNQELLDRLLANYPRYTKSHLLLINIKQQQLYFLSTRNTSNKSYIISSALNGTGNQNGSGQTPLGAHFIREKFGDNARLGSTFKGRKETGRIATILLEANEQSTEDNITTRIMWLSGLEESYNQGSNVDSYSRYIYIHGTDEEGRLGTPASHGCIRMSNNDVVELYANISLNTLVYIFEE